MYPQECMLRHSFKDMSKDFPASPVGASDLLQKMKRIQQRWRLFCRENAERTRAAERGKNVKDAPSVARCVGGWIIIPEKDLHTLDLTKQTILWVAEFLNLGSSQSFLWGVCFGLFQTNSPVSSKTWALWLWHLHPLPFFGQTVSNVIDLQSSCEGEF